MLAVTPFALGGKLQVQYDATPQCVPREDVGPGPGSRAARESQRAFESVEHVGHFGGGGGSGVGGCDRPFVLLEDVGVLQHYRSALPEGGWRVVEDDAQHLRAERDGMAFEVSRATAVVSCGPGAMATAAARVATRAGDAADRAGGC